MAAPGQSEVMKRMTRLGGLCTKHVFEWESILMNRRCRYSLSLFCCLLAASITDCSDDSGPVGGGEADLVTDVDDDTAVDTFDGDAFVIPRETARVPAGVFTMGSEESEVCRNASNETAHEVALTHNIMVTVTHTTQGQFEDLLGFNPTSFPDCGPNCPVETVNWHQAAAYCNALSEDEGHDPCYRCVGTEFRTSCSVLAEFEEQGIYDCPGYRLPTEAEWEFLYRAGTTSALYNGENRACEGEDENAAAIAWYAANSEQTPHPVGQKEPNAWGLYDMAGNVWHWCHDRYEEDLGKSPKTDPWGTDFSGTVTVRGGSWATGPSEIRGAARSSITPNTYDGAVGFRCVRSYGP